MKKGVIILFFLFMGVSFVNAAEQLEEPKSLRELIVLGLKTNLGLQVELLDTRKAADQVIVEEAAFDSQLFASMGYRRSSTPYAATFTLADTNDADEFSGRVGIGKTFESGLHTTLTLDTAWLENNDLTSSLDPSYRTAVVLDLSQPLLRNLGASVNTTHIRMSENRQRQASLRFLLRAQELTLQLELSARQLAAKTAVIGLRKEALDLADELLEANRRRFDLGVIAVTQVQEAETALASRKLSLSQAVQERDLLRERINRQLNHSLSNQFNAAGLIVPTAAVSPPDLPDIQQLFTVAAGKRLELKINDFSLQNISLERHYLDNQLKPQLDLNLQAGFNGLSGSEHFATGGSRYAGNWSDSVSSMVEGDGYQWRIGIDFSVPLGNRAAKSRLHQAELQLKQDRYRRQDLEAAIRDDLLRQTINVSQTWQQLKIADEFEALAQRSLKQEQRRLEEGLSDTFRIIHYQNAMISARIDRINALTRYQLALAQIDFASGKIFERHHIVLAKNSEELSLEDI